MSAIDVPDLAATELAKMIADGELSAVEAVEASLARALRARLAQHDQPCPRPPL